MATDLGADDDINTIKSLQGTDTTWLAKVAALLRNMLHSGGNPFGPAARLDTLASVTSMPVGGIVDYISASIPNGYVECDGRSLSRTAYSELFAVIGTRYGSDAADTFKVPDFRRRQAVGRALNGAVGVATGSETTIMSADNLPSHSHVATGLTVGHSGGHRHTSSDADFAGNNNFLMGENQNYTAGPYAATSIYVWQDDELWHEDVDDYDAADHSTQFNRNGQATRQASSAAQNDHTHAVTGNTSSTGGSANIGVVSPSVVMVKAIYHGVT